ncbi:MAG TPA: DNA-binding response regulator, partial [Stenotrophomonas sp.]|nr:DNA-binding response regulator [Stenotrophomonas sp.]
MTDNAAATARILIVDDDPDIGALLAEYLGRHGLHTDTAAEGKAMWAALDRQRFDAVVLDLMLPGEDGLSLCQQLRARTALPVIMLT